MALRREAWLDAGPFDEGFRFYGQDLDLCAALRGKGWRVALLPAFRVLHHHGATIGRLAGAGAVRQDLELLWSDLLRWAAKRRGPAWARRAGAALAAGGRLRLFARCLALPFLPALPPARRTAWRDESRALSRALLALASRPGLPHARPPV
jgi:GT2 family glycosyltransferase